MRYLPKPVVFTKKISQFTAQNSIGRKLSSSQSQANKSLEMIEALDPTVDYSNLPTVPPVTANFLEICLLFSQFRQSAQSRKSGRTPSHIPYCERLQQTKYSDRIDTKRLTYELEQVAEALGEALGEAANAPGVVGKAALKVYNFQAQLHELMQLWLGRSEAAKQCSATRAFSPSVLVQLKTALDILLTIYNALEEGEKLAATRASSNIEELWEINRGLKATGLFSPNGPLRVENERHLAWIVQQTAEAQCAYPSRSSF